MLSDIKQLKLARQAPTKQVFIVFYCLGTYKSLKKYIDFYFFLSPSNKRNL